MDRNTRQMRFVLRLVKLRNFIKFRDQQELKFDTNGTYYLIGGNQSGKTSVCEAVRRCLSMKNNSSMSSAPDSSKHSIVVCRYVSENGYCLISFYIHQANKNDVIFKGCVVLDEKEIIKNIGLDQVEFQEDGPKVLWSYDMSVLEAGTLFTSAKLAEKGWLDECIDWLNAATSHGKGETNREACEQLLQQHLDGVVFTFPMRGIGPLQWSLSDKVTCKAENYREASDRAEIIKWYLAKQKSEEEEKEEDDIYRFITNNKGGIYSLDTNGLVVVNKEMPILKQSEGFIEAKICSILLVDKTFTTLGLEDPGTGMHTQMIERLRTLMLCKITDKVVIISTHTPNFIKQELFRNIFFLTRNKEGTCEITAGTALADDTKLMSAIPGSVSGDQFATLCFSEQTVFVEGPSDVQFMEAFTTFMRQSQKDRLFPDIHFVSMGGGKKANHFRKCCKALKKKYFFILDNDVKKRTARSIQNEARKTSMNSENEEMEKHFFWENVKDIEGVMFDILEKLKESCVSVTEIDDILRKCFPDRLEIADGKIKNIKSITEPNVPSLKIFLTGKETFDDRVKLFKFLMSDGKTIDALQGSDGGNNLERLHAFLKKIAEAN